MIAFFGIILLAVRFCSLLKCCYENHRGNIKYFYRSHLSPKFLILLSTAISFYIPMSLSFSKSTVTSVNVIVRGKVSLTIVKLHPTKNISMLNVCFSVLAKKKAKNFKKYCVSNDPLLPSQILPIFDINEIAFLIWIISVSGVLVKLNLRNCKPMSFSTYGICQDVYIINGIELRWYWHVFIF